jgi:Protein of unknown function (DUF2877)
MSTTCAVSVGHCLDLETVRGGMVHSVFDHAVNLLVASDLWTLLDAGRHDMPFGIRVEPTRLAMVRPRPGDLVSVRSGFVGMASGAAAHVVDCRSAARWWPRRASRLARGLERRLAVVETTALVRAWCGASASADAVRSVVVGPDIPPPGALSPIDHSEAAPCAASARAATLGSVVGAGPGATPSGDDVLIGAFAVLTAPEAGEPGATAARELAELIQPLLPRTTDISAHLLRQAADGRISRPLQDLIGALVADSDLETTRAAARVVVDTGATSGADTCMGVLAVAASFLLPYAERANA